MKIPVDIRILRERYPNDPKKQDIPEDTESYFVSGSMKRTKGGYLIEFRESTQETFTTVDAYSDGTVSINRVGPMNTHMVFMDGRALTCICNTGFTPFQINVRTEQIDNTLTLDGGRLDIRYSVEIHGNLAEKSRLLLSVSPDSSIIRS